MSEIPNLTALRYVSFHPQKNSLNMSIYKFPRGRTNIYTLKQEFWAQRAWIRTEAFTSRPTEYVFFFLFCIVLWIIRGYHCVSVWLKYPYTWLSNWIIFNVENVSRNWLATFFLQSLDVAGVRLILVLKISFLFSKEISLSLLYHVRDSIQVGFL